jgi:hypothetical protein
MAEVEIFNKYVFTMNKTLLELFWRQYGFLFHPTNLQRCFTICFEVLFLAVSFLSYFEKATAPVEL